MEAIDVGWFSIIPPIIAIILALITKEVISSLLIGILSGTLIYSGGDIIKAVESMFELMTSKIGGSNAYILVFLALLGSLVVVVTMAGGSKAYGNWASRKIKTQTGAKLATCGLGSLIFIDDYFNCLTVGTVMRPVTDKQKISRAKLAYIIDSTAAPICIIAPISTWAVAVGSTIQDSGVENGLNSFIASIPYNFYAILTIIMVVILCITKFDFGPMKKIQNKVEQTGIIDSESEENEESIEGVEISNKGKVWDLIIPISCLIITTVLAMLYTGGFFSGQGISVHQAFGNTNANVSLVLGGFVSLIVAMILFVPRKIMSFKDFMIGLGAGVKSMVPAFIILILAWTMSGVCRDLLNTGSFVGHIVSTSNIPMWILPTIIFIVAAFLAFAMGTSWGTFGILLPIVIELSSITDSSFLVILIAATLAGSVYGDHCSPISDTTILSSTGAGCNHISHVSTQIVYASLVAGCSLLGYLFVGIFKNPYVALAISILVLLISIYIINLFQKKRQLKLS